MEFRMNKFWYMVFISVGVMVLSGIRWAEADRVALDEQVMEEELDQERKAHQFTRELKNRLEQANLQLEEEKALAAINKLKKENSASFNEPSPDHPKDFPDIKISYIGGNDLQKEAIISIAGANYQVKPQALVMDNIEVTAITDAQVKIHFNKPYSSYKTFEFKPE